MVTISMPVQEAEVISTTAIPLGISNLTFGIIVALIFGGFIFIVRYGKQCCESIAWIIDTCKMNLGKGAGEKGESALVKRQQDHCEYVPILLENKHLYH